MKIITRYAIGSAIASLPLSALACSSCGCTLGGDWDSQGFTTQPGVRIELRRDYLNQSQLRSGTSTVDRQSIVLPANREIEQSTRNRYTTFGIDYSPSADWGINLQLPYIDRSHATVSPGDTEPSFSQSRSMGDARVLARYQGFSAERNYGIQFGIKLPTGEYKNTFNGGPQQGQPLDRGLQSGSGTTDALLGAFYVSSLTDNLDYFTQGLIQAPLNAKADYKPGASLNLNAGLRYVAGESMTPELQLNARTVLRDSGAAADADNSGGTLVYLAPGVTVNLTKQINLFGFVQVPVYQRVNGYQLAPRYTASVGARYLF